MALFLGVHPWMMKGTIAVVVAAGEALHEMTGVTTGATSVDLHAEMIHAIVETILEIAETSQEIVLIVVDLLVEMTATIAVAAAVAAGEALQGTTGVMTGATSVDLHAEMIVEMTGVISVADPPKEEMTGAQATTAAIGVPDPDPCPRLILSVAIVQPEMILLSDQVAIKNNHRMMAGAPLLNGNKLTAVNFVV